MENKLFQKSNPNRQKLIKPISDLDINEEVVLSFEVKDIHLAIDFYAE